MREAHIDAAQADLLGTFLRESVKVDERLAATVREDLDLAPCQSACAGAERLHHRFLRRETGCEFGHAPPTKGNFLRCIDATEETIGVPQQHSPDAGYL